MFVAISKYWWHFNYYIFNAFLSTYVSVQNLLCPWHFSWNFMLDYPSSGVDMFASMRSSDCKISWGWGIWDIFKPISSLIFTWHCYVNGSSFSLRKFWSACCIVLRNFEHPFLFLFCFYLDAIIKMYLMSSFLVSLYKQNKHTHFSRYWACFR